MDECDPEELEAMDAALSDIFRDKKQKQVEKSNEKKDDEHTEQFIHDFKVRVLDLIDLFVEQEKNGTRCLVSLC